MAEKQVQIKVKLHAPDAKLTTSKGPVKNGDVVKLPADEAQACIDREVAFPFAGDADAKG